MPPWNQLKRIFTRRIHENTHLFTPSSFFCTPQTQTFLVLCEFCRILFEVSFRYFKWKSYRIISWLLFLFGDQKWDRFFSCNDIIKVRVSFKKWITLMIYVSCSIHSWFVKCLWSSCNKNNVASIVTLIYPLLASYILTICPSWCFLGWTGFFVKR